MQTQEDSAQVREGAQSDPGDTSETDKNTLTFADGNQACWTVVNGVVRVLWVYLNGTLTDLPDQPALGACYPGIMPRSLWDRVRFEYDYSRIP